MHQRQFSLGSFVVPIPYPHAVCDIIFTALELEASSYLSTDH